MNPKILKIILILLPIILMALLAFFYFSSHNNGQVRTSSLPTPTPTIYPTTPFKPSKWAGDETILSIESEINALESEAGKTDLRLQPILPPALDTQIKFE